MTVDATGTAHVAWGSPSSPALSFCRLPRGATDCAVRSTLPVSGESLSRPFVRVGDGGVVDVVQYRYGTGEPYDGVFRWTSTDGGASWGAARLIGTVPFHDAALGPGDAVSFATDAVTQGQLYQRAPLDGSAQATTHANLAADRPHSGSVAIVDGVPIVVLADGSANAFVRRFSGMGDPNDAANWLAPVEIGTGRYMRLAPGPTGLFLWSIADDGFGEVRRYNGNGFGAGLPLSTAKAGAHGELHQDPGGRVHAIWSQGAADGIHLFHAVSDDGASFRRGDLGVTTEGGIDEPRAAVGADHVGVVAWGGVTGGTAVVKLQAIGPEPPLPPKPPEPQEDPKPEFGKTAVVRAVSGSVLVKPPGGGPFVPLGDVGDIPVGSTIDTRKGRVELTIATRDGGSETAQFYTGLFTLTQAPDGTGILKLTGGSFARCGKRARASAAARSKRKVRRLWGDGKGRFRTTGKYAAGTVRGTRWLTEDRCDGTLVRVLSGVVRVRDLARRRTVTVRAGKRYFARAR